MLLGQNEVKTGCFTDTLWKDKFRRWNAELKPLPPHAPSYKLKTHCPHTSGVLGPVLSFCSWSYSVVGRVGRPSAGGLLVSWLRDYSLLFFKKIHFICALKCCNFLGPYIKSWMRHWFRDHQGEIKVSKPKTCAPKWKSLGRLLTNLGCLWGNEMNSKRRKQNLE